jgi:hypothetical protein
VQDGLKSSPSRSTVDVDRQNMIYKVHVPFAQSESSQDTHVGSQQEPNRTPFRVENDTSTCMAAAETSMLHNASFQQCPHVLSSEFVNFHYHQERRSWRKRSDECDLLRVPWMVPSAYL